ncbi:MAG: hypothetical protein ACO3JL_00100 [Myxococcota bacterium]
MYMRHSCLVIAALLSSTASLASPSAAEAALVSWAQGDSTLLAQLEDDADYDEEELEEAPEKKKVTAPRKKSSGSTTGATKTERTSSTSKSSGASRVSPMGRTFGVGLQVGAPTALTGKFVLGHDRAAVVGVGAGYGFFLDPAMSLHADYLYYPSSLFRNETLQLSWFIGVGGWAALYQSGRYNFVVPGVTYWFNSPVFLAARVPIGVNLALREAPLEFYLEGDPALSVFPIVSFGLGFSAGARFYF